MFYEVFLFDGHPGRTTLTDTCAGPQRLPITPNGSFNSGISAGWTTDSSTITSDAGTNGSYPDPTNSVKLVATTKAVHLFSPKVAIDPAATYMLKNFVNVPTLKSGEVSFYIDEYNSAGTWISGQYKAAERAVWADAINFSYKATSANVASASLQVAVGANTGITAYFDNAQWFPLTAANPAPTPSPTPTPIPTPTPTPTPIPTGTNLITNGTFESGMTGWTTDSATTMTLDSANNGSPANPARSVKVVASTKNTHLFSAKVPVVSTKTYSLSSYVNVKQITGGEVGFYVDEYDGNGNWISGKYITGVRAVGAGTASFSYTPSSANVKSASLQFIVVANSGITAYIDDVKWF